MPDVVWYALMLPTTRQYVGALTLSRHINSYAQRDLPPLRRNVVADLNTDCPPHAGHFRQHWSEERAVEIPDQFLVDWLTREIAAKNILEQSFRRGAIASDSSA